MQKILLEGYLDKSIKLEACLIAKNKQEQFEIVQSLVSVNF